MKISNSRQKLLLAIILVLAVVLRFVSLTEIPYRVDGDASRFALDGLYYWISFPPLFSTGWQGHTNAYFYLVGLVLKIFESDLLGLRVLSASAGLLGVLATYFFVKDSFGKAAALWASLFLATSPFHLAFSRNGMEVVWMTFFAPIVLFLLSKNNKYSILFSGIFAGLSQYFSPASRLIPILAVTYCIFFGLYGTQRKKVLNKLVIFVLGFLFVYAPMIIYYITNPEAYTMRIKLVSLFGSQWLTQELQNRSIISIMGEQVKKSFLAFHFPVRHVDNWYYRTPFLDPALVIIFSIGLIKGLTRVKEIPYRMVYVYLILGIILGGVLTLDSPFSSRYIILFPAVAGFIGLGITAIIELWKKPFLKKIAATIATFLLLFQIYSYWNHETKDTWNFDRNTQVATYAGRYLANVPDEYNSYFLSDGSMDANFPTLLFLSQRQITDIDILISNPFAKIKPEGKNIFIILPSRGENLDQLKYIFKNSVETKIYNPNGYFLFWILKT